MVSAATCCTCVFSPNTWARIVRFLIRRTEFRLSGTIEEYAADYVAAMLVHQPIGPFYLGGHSYGAMVAYEMALQLVKQGHEIGLLAIIDQQKPGWRLKAGNAIPAVCQILANLPGRLSYELSRTPPAGRSQEIRRLLWRWSKAAFRHRQDAASMFGIDSGEAALASLFDAPSSSTAYRPLPSPVPITLFRASVQLLSHAAMDPTLGWSDLAEGKVRIHVIPGDHISITTEPLVRHLARTISNELDAAQSLTGRSELTGQRIFEQPNRIAL